MHAAAEEGKSYCRRCSAARWQPCVCRLLASTTARSPPMPLTAPPLPQEMKGEERMVCHFFRNSMPCKVRGSGSGSEWRAVLRGRLCVHSSGAAAWGAWPGGSGRCGRPLAAHAAASRLLPTRCTAPPPCPPAASSCQIMDKHLALLAGKHLETKFVRVHAEKAPFLTGTPLLAGAGGAAARPGRCHSVLLRASPAAEQAPDLPPPCPSPHRPPAQSGSRCGCCPRWPSSSTRKRQTM